MRSRRTTVAASATPARGRNEKFRISVVALLVASMVAPLIFLAPRITYFSSSSFARTDFSDGQQPGNKEDTGDNFFSKEILDIIRNAQGPPLNKGFVAGKDLSSSLVKESASEKETTTDDHVHIENQQTTNISVFDEPKFENPAFHNQTIVQEKIAENATVVEDPEKTLRKDEDEKTKLEAEAIKKSAQINDTIIGKHSLWNPEPNTDSDVRLMRDQLIMAKVYLSIAEARRNHKMTRELSQRIRDSQRSLGEASYDVELPRSAKERIRSMGKLLTKARQQFFDCNAVVKKLRAMLQASEDHAHLLKKQSSFLNQLAAKTMPKGLHCLALRLNVEYNMLPPEQQEFPLQEQLEDDRLYHYALFSDNILAASVVVNSTVLHAKEPEKHVFHLVTDKLNFAAMKMWFLNNPPGMAAIQVENVDDFKWLNSSYCPVLHQLETAAMKEYYFKQDHVVSVSSGSSNLKYRNPKYLSMLNHLRFYLPEIYPKLSKVLFLDDDVVVQKDLTPLWDIDLQGNVNGAVETCGTSFHRFDKYLNFSNPHISRNFDPDACGWAYGMNMFDLNEWKKRDITGIYHKWQRMNEDRTLWKLGTLPPGLITFYNLTYPLDKSWHVLGLGYNPAVEIEEIEGAAVIHYNGNSKPWLEIAQYKFKPYWSRYVKYDHSYLQECNIQ